MQFVGGKGSFKTSPTEEKGLFVCLFLKPIALWEKNEYIFNQCSVHLIHYFSKLELSGFEA